MKINIYRKDESVPLPKRGTEFSVGMDVYSCEECVLHPNVPTLVNTGLIIQCPPEYYIELFMRSGLSRKGIMLANSVGIIDEDYCGPEDFIKFNLVNITDNNFTIFKNERIGQLIFKKNEFPRITWVESKSPGFKSTSRMGFGSTGNM